jgi:hypothetical protein
MNRKRRQARSSFYIRSLARRSQARAGKRSLAVTLQTIKSPVVTFQTVKSLIMTL